MPPGAVSIDVFKARCTACGLCMAACPSRVIRPAGPSAYGLTGLLMPKLDFSVCSCDVECTRCADVCPSHALRRLVPAERARTRVGVAVWDPAAGCTAARGEAECGLCAVRCPKAAISMAAGADGTAHPVVDERRCIGCGDCQRLCPAKPGAFRVRPLAVQSFAFGEETLVAYRPDGSEWTSRSRGVKPLLDALDDPSRPLAGARLYDRIVGRAAAYLYVALGIRSVSSPVVSTGALRILRTHAIPCDCQEQVPAIRNRAGTGPCPMDASVQGLADCEIASAVEAIRAKYEELAK